LKQKIFSNYLLIIRKTRRERKRIRGGKEMVATRKLKERKKQHQF